MKQRLKRPNGLGLCLKTAVLQIQNLKLRSPDIKDKRFLEAREVESVRDSSGSLPHFETNPQYNSLRKPEVVCASADCLILKSDEDFMNWKISNHQHVTGKTEKAF